MWHNVRKHNLPSFFLHSSHFLLNSHDFIAVCSIQLSTVTAQGEVKEKN